MNGSKSIPPLTYLKYKAKLLRDESQINEKPISHSKSLELLAHQYGCRDWNALSAIAKKQMSIVSIGQKVEGSYLGQKFKGMIKGVRLTENLDRTHITIVFDKAVDVVCFESFSNFRKQVSCCVSQHATTFEKTSNGEPQLALYL
ncbi:glyoxalase superfamily protein [Curvivirga sp.]|uniref:glyoxalase superfamily protein n=1 Tax=Curvivirga sp. TaxID=2856848 RepID=UPI003B5A7654